MKNKKFLLMVAVSFMLCIVNLQAQETITASGGTVSGSTGSVSYSIGQVVYTTVTGVNGIVPLGVQQPYKFSIGPGVDNAKVPMLSCLVYPNPTSDLLTLKVENNVDFAPAALSFQLYDVDGKLIEKKKITTNETNISMLKLKTSVYQLVVTYNNESKTFKIIKK